LRPERDLPAILVEDYSEERLPHLRPPHRPAPGALLVHPPGSEVVRRVAAVLTTVKQDYERTIGTHRDFHPRTHSRVEHRIDRRADDALADLCHDTELQLSVGPLRLTGDASRARYDIVEHEYRMPCRLHLPWSWPDLPMWLAVGEISSTRGALRLSLRSRRRMRYPVRYFHATHAVLTGLESRLTRTA
jgi:hypothetical protein